MQIQIGKTLNYASSYAAASGIWEMYRDSRRIGASRMPLVQVVEDDGTIRAISYNGIVWPCASVVAAINSGAEPIYEPEDDLED